MWYLQAKAKQASGKRGDTLYSITGYFAKKLVRYQNAMVPASIQIETYPFPIIRLADLYLLYAEALNEYLSSPSDDVYNAIISLRKRVGIEPGDDEMYGLKKSMSQAEMRSVIQNERRIEMAFEEQRYWDIRRWRIAEEVFEKPLEGLNIQISGAITTYNKINVLSTIFDIKRYFYPIPYSEVNKNKNMVQNPNW